MHLVMLDTCVWLDKSSQNVVLPMATALKHLVQDGPRVLKALGNELARCLENPGGLTDLQPITP